MTSHLNYLATLAICLLPLTLAVRPFDLSTTNSHILTLPQTDQPQPHSTAPLASSTLLTTNDPAQPLSRLDLRLSSTLAQLTSVAYCSDTAAIADWSCGRCGDVPSFEPSAVVLDKDKDILAFIGWWPDIEGIVVVFRGTSSASLKNWIDNLTTGTTDVSFPSAEHPHVKIHTGFWRTWLNSTLRTKLQAALEALLHDHPAAPVYFVGHSLGGALAQISAMDLKFEYELTDVNVYTFGSPRVGNNAFAELVSAATSASWRFTHGRDVVPSVPLALMGFHHAATEVWEVDDKDDKGAPLKEITICDDSGEDPRCHASGCNLIGLCTSVEDHLTYLNVAMKDGC